MTAERVRLLYADGTYPMTAGFWELDADHLAEVQTALNDATTAAMLGARRTLTASVANAHGLLDGANVLRAVRLNFRAGGQSVAVVLPSPVAALFMSDGKTLDMGADATHALRDALVGVITSRTGAVVDTLLGGYKIQLPRAPMPGGWG